MDICTHHAVVCTSSDMLQELQKSTGHPQEEQRQPLNTTPTEQIIFNNYVTPCQPLTATSPEQLLCEG